ncbi:unnamed protein product [Urochloa humidicola]
MDGDCSSRAFARLSMFSVGCFMMNKSLHACRKELCPLGGDPAKCLKPGNYSLHGVSNSYRWTLPIRLIELVIFVGLRLIRLGETSIMNVSLQYCVSRLTIYYITLTLKTHGYNAGSNSEFVKFMNVGRV